MQDETKTSAMFELVEQWQQSGMSRKQFSSEKGIRLHRFGYWVKKYNQSQVAHPGFASLTIGPDPLIPATQPRISIDLGDGVVVRIY